MVNAIVEERKKSIIKEYISVWVHICKNLFVYNPNYSYSTYMYAFTNNNLLTIFCTLQTNFLLSTIRTIKVNLFYVYERVAFYCLNNLFR